MRDRLVISQFNGSYSLGYPASGSLKPGAGSAHALFDSTPSGSAPYLVKWHVTRNAQRLHVSEPLATLTAAFLEARALLAIHPVELWIEGPGGVYIDEQEISDANRGRI